MTSVEKIITKFLRDPGSVIYKDIEKILLHIGFEKSQGRGSHVKFSHSNCDQKIIFALHNNDCKKVYKKDTHKMLLKNNLLQQ